jgi:hypothetical protein
MNRRAINGRREYARRRKHLVEIFAHTASPGILCRLKGREITRERIAHGQASAPASDLARLLDETGGER